MYELKTKPTGADVDAFIATIGDDRKRADAERLRTLLEEASGERARMWGTSIVGVGSYHYRYASGHEGDTHAAGFSSRAKAFTLYITGGFDEHEATLARLGKHKTSKGCLSIARLDDVDESALGDLIHASIASARAFDTTPGG